MKKNYNLNSKMKNEITEITKVEDSIIDYYLLIKNRIVTKIFNF